MTRFTTRIQLEDATESDYQSLHKQLKQDRSIIIKEALPDRKGSLASKTEFSLEGNITLQEATSVVANAAAKTGRKYSFTVMKNKTTNIH